MDDPHGIIGMEVPAADGGDYGYRVWAFDPKTKDYIVQPIRWSTGEPHEDSSKRTIDEFKITYRYDLKRARRPMKEDHDVLAIS